MAIPCLVFTGKEGGKKGLNGIGEEINCWNLGSLGARKDALVAEKEGEEQTNQPTTRVAPKHFTFLKYTHFL